MEPAAEYHVLVMLFLLFAIEQPNRIRDLSIHVLTALSMLLKSSFTPYIFSGLFLTIILAFARFGQDCPLELEAWFDTKCFFRILSFKVWNNLNFNLVNALENRDFPKLNNANPCNRIMNSV